MDKEKITHLKELVLKEAINLKKHAKTEELSKLDFISLDGSKARTCIYGQMTGHCNSYRSIHLLKNCAYPFSASVSRLLDVDDNLKWDIDLSSLFDIDFDPDWYTRDFSAIEFYINSKNRWLDDGFEGTKDLISFLKGEKETLTINDL